MNNEEQKKRLCTASVELNISKHGANLRTNDRIDHLMKEAERMQAEYDALVHELAGASLPLSVWGEKVMRLNDLGVRIATFQDTARRIKQASYVRSDRSVVQV